MKKAWASKVFLPLRPASWTAEDLRVLRELAEQGCSAQMIAKRLRRTVSSVRNKGLMHGLSLNRITSRHTTTPTSPIAEKEARAILAE